MATAADVGKWALSMGATPIEEVLSASELGTTNSLIEVTNFDSDPGRTEYIAGLSDGSEMAIECNRVDGAAGQVALVTAVRAQSTESFTLVYDSTTTYTFDAVCMSEKVNPSISEQNTLSFSVKLTGDIVET